MNQCCGSGPFFQIRIHGSCFSNMGPDPDPGDQKKTGSGSDLDMFICFLTKSIHIMTLKIKDKNYLNEIVFLTILNNKKIWVTGVILWLKNPDPVLSRIRVIQKDRIRRDPDPVPPVKRSSIDSKFWIYGNLFFLETKNISVSLKKKDRNSEFQAGSSWKKVNLTLNMF